MSGEMAASTQETLGSVAADLFRGSRSLKSDLQILVNKIDGSASEPPSDMKESDPCSLSDYLHQTRVELARCQDLLTRSVSIL